jgi:transposase InsO family protein
MAKPSRDPPTTRFVIRILKSYWVPVFQAPTAVLTDRGSQFIAKEFRAFITEELAAILVYMSPYYPQGNAVNEASHKALDRVISDGSFSWRL